MANQIATWLNKGYAEKLVKAATGYWEQSRNYVMWAVQQKNEQQNEEPILGLLAWERLTQRLNSEPLDLYRKRVQHALVNTIDAGEIATIKDIFNRLDLQVINVRERIEGRDWDIIAIDMTDSALASAYELLPELIQLYGRTCRRYELTVHNLAAVSLSLGITHVQWDNNYVSSATKINAITGIDHGVAHSFLGLDALTSNTRHQAINIGVQHNITAHQHYGFLSKDGGISTAKEQL